MLQDIKKNLWHQFGASIDMLENAIALWPESLWYTDKKFFYMAYHTLFFLDYYLTFPPKDFSPKLPCTVTEAKDAPPEALDDLIPNTIYTKAELLDYLQICRDRCHKLITLLTEERLNERWIEEPGNPDTRSFSTFELLLYNMRHVQHHAAQLNMLLRERTHHAPNWVSRTKKDA